MASTILLELEMTGRLALAAGLAGVLGWERQLGQQPAGLRTHMLVSLGAAGFTVAGTLGVAGHGTVQDAGRVAAQVVTGIGFIGAGAIWRSAGNERLIRGLTTAASIWLAAAIGMLAGFGLYVLATGCALLGVVVLRLLRGVERVPLTVWRAVRDAALPAPRTTRQPQPLRPSGLSAALGAAPALDGGTPPPSRKRAKKRRKQKRVAPERELVPA